MMASMETLLILLKVQIKTIVGTKLPIVEVTMVGLRLKTYKDYLVHLKTMGMKTIG